MGPRSFREARGTAGLALQRILASNDHNFAGGGFGMRATYGVRLNQPACVVYVVRKLPREELPPSRLLPRTMEVGGIAIDVDVVETGPFRRLAFDQRKRPVPAGISISHIRDNAAGTYGALVKDKANGMRLSMLSNNHVLARMNAATIGDSIIQPGGLDGGDSGDVVANLARFVPLNYFGDNGVDAAIAHFVKSSDAVNTLMGADRNVAALPTDKNPAVGLLFGGGATRTLMNPINRVLQALNIELMNRGAYTTYDKGDEVFRISVAKAGRTTEVTRNQLAEVDATVKVGGYGPNEDKTLTFTGQLTAQVMGCPGDSGSLIVKVDPAPTYGDVPCANPGSCAFLGTAENMTGIPFRQEGDLVRTARDKYLMTTKLGRWLVDMVYVNQIALFQRGEATAVQPGDRALAQALYTKYLGEVKLAIADPTREDLRLTQAHLTDVRLALDSIKKYLTQDEANAAEVFYNIVNGGIGKRPDELIAMLNDPGIYQTVVTLFGEAPAIKLVDPYRG
jgi:hypothetical protein